MDLASSRHDGKKTAASICDWLPEEITLSQTHLTKGREVGLGGLGNCSRAIALRQVQNATASDLLQAAFGETGNKIPYPP